MFLVLAGVSSWFFSGICFAGFPLKILSGVFSITFSNASVRFFSGFYLKFIRSSEEPFQEFDWLGIPQDSSRNFFQHSFKSSLKCTSNSSSVNSPKNFIWSFTKSFSMKICMSAFKNSSRSFCDDVFRSPSGSSFLNPE